jgi:hypothetical protein
MYNNSQNFVSPTVDTAAKYITSYNLHPHDDGQQYLVLKNYHLDLVPGNITLDFGNLFDGNKVLGELASCVLQNTARATSGYR